MLRCICQRWRSIKTIKQKVSRPCRISIWYNVPNDNSVLIASVTECITLLWPYFDNLVIETMRYCLIISSLQVAILLIAYHRFFFRIFDSEEYDCCMWTDCRPESSLYLSTSGVVSGRKVRLLGTQKMLFLIFSVRYSHYRWETGRHKSLSNLLHHDRLIHTRSIR